MIARRPRKGSQAPHLHAGALALAALLLAAFAAPPAQAQTAIPGAPGAPAEGEPAKVEDLESLLAALENPAEREKLAAQLRALIAARKGERERPIPAVRLMDVVSQAVDAVSKEIARGAQILVDVPEVFAWLRRQVGDPAARAAVAGVAARLLVVLGLGVTAQWLVHMALRRPRQRLGGAPGGTRIVRFMRHFARSVLELAPILAFAAVAYGALPFVRPDAVTLAVATALINAAVLARTIRAGAMIVLAPDQAPVRLVPASDETAHYAFLWVRRLANTSVYGYFAAEAGRLLGLHPVGHAAALNVLGLVIALMLVVLTLQNRKAVRAWIRGTPPARAPIAAGTLQALRNLVADLWHVVAIFYLGALYLVFALRVEGGFNFVLTATVMTAVILAAARLLVLVVDRAIARGFAVNAELRRRFPTLEARANRYLPVLNGAAKAAIYGGAAMTLLQVWGVRALDWFASETGREVAGTVIGTAVVIVVAVLIWESLSLYMEGVLARGEADFESAERFARARTLLPLFRKVLSMLLVAIVALIVLAQLGINIAPLLFSAGIIGLAVGFGAQKLVQDIFNGLFIFLEAAVAVGDVVELAGHEGVVEAMTIRSIRLRDLDGNVHTIPFSAVSAVLNRTKGFSYASIDIGVAYKEDIDRVIEALKAVGADMQRDPAFAPSILEPIDILGLDRFADSALIVKARIKTLPGKQWPVRREFNRRLKTKFAELGIEIPFPQLVVTMSPAGAPAGPAVSAPGP